MLGFTRSFAANHPCRICKIRKDTMTSLCKEIFAKSFLRNEANYWEDVSSNDVSASGIRESCIFCKINSFKITDNISVDIMHDLFEGICHIELCNIVANFILEKYL